MNWLELAVPTVPENVETVSNIFAELGSGGVAIEDPAVILRYIEAKVWDYYEFSPDQLKAQLPVVKAYFPMDEYLTGKMASLRQALAALPAGATPEILTRTVAEEDWATAWQKYYKPVEIGCRLAVKPSWEEYTPAAGRLVLEMDPGMAFGCGNHPTTTMCMEFLEEVVAGGELVADVGTGTGILAITAAKLGAAKVAAVDLDAVAVKVARENVALNQVADTVQVQQGNLLDLVPAPVDLIIANIVADVIIKLASDAAGLLPAGGKLITSGIIQFRAAEVKQYLEQVGFRITGTRSSGEWVAYLAVKL